MPAKFLIFGASSFYGSNFARYVREQGDDAAEMSRPAFDISKGDMWRFRQEYDYVVNFISNSLVAESWKDPAQWMYINGAMTTNMFENIRSLRIKRFIHVSTPESYGSTEDWVDEKYATWRPSTPYAVSRAAADMMLTAFHSAYGFPGIITRTANIYGPGQGKNRIIPLAYEKKARNEMVDLHGGGDSIRCFIHVRDACAATYLIAKEGQPGETYHISTRDPIAIWNLLRMTGVRYRTAPERLGKDHAYLLNSDKLRSMGWSEKISLQQGLRECASSH